MANWQRTAEKSNDRKEDLYKKTKTTAGLSDGQVGLRAVDPKVHRLLTWTFLVKMNSPAFMRTVVDT